MRIVKTIGFQQMTAANLASSYAMTLPNVDGQKPNAAFLSCTSTAVRYRSDGTAPTASVGMRVVAGASPFLWMGDMEKFRAILESGSPTLDIEYVLVSD